MTESPQPDKAQPGEARPDRARPDNGRPDEGPRDGGPRHGGPVPAGSELNRWVATLVEDLGVNPDAVDSDLLLDLAQEVAHGVARPAVPLTSFLVGYAVGLGGGDRQQLDRVVARAAELARGWDADRRTDEHTP